MRSRTKLNEYLRVKAAAEYLGVARNTLRSDQVRPVGRREIAQARVVA